MPRTCAHSLISRLDFPPHFHAGVLHQHAEVRYACYIQHLFSYTRYTCSTGEEMITLSRRAWSSSRSTSQRMKQAISKVFFGYTSKLIYIVTSFHASDISSIEALNFLQLPHRLCHNYLITACKKVNCYWGCNNAFWSKIRIMLICIFVFLPHKTRLFASLQFQSLPLF